MEEEHPAGSYTISIRAADQQNRECKNYLTALTLDFAHTQN